MTGGAGHLGDRVSRYVDRTLAPEVLRRLDRHLVTCEICRAATDAERRLLASLRSSRTPAVPVTLTAALRGLSSSPAPRPAPRPAYSSGPSPVLPTVPPRAPALHRSAVRAVLLAGLAAGASAAAAWGIAATGSVTGTAGPGPLPETATRLAGQPGNGRYAFPGSERLGSDGPFARGWGLPATALSGGAGGSATGISGSATGISGSSAGISGSATVTGTSGFATASGGSTRGIGGASSRVLPVAVPVAAHPLRRGGSAGRTMAP